MISGKRKYDDSASVTSIPRRIREIEESEEESEDQYSDEEEEDGEDEEEEGEEEEEQDEEVEAEENEPEEVQDEEISDEVESDRESVKKVDRRLDQLEASVKALTRAVKKLDKEVEHVKSKLTSYKKIPKGLYKAIKSALLVEGLFPNSHFGNGKFESIVKLVVKKLEVPGGQVDDSLKDVIRRKVSLCRSRIVCTVRDILLKGYIGLDARKESIQDNKTEFCGEIEEDEDKLYEVLKTCHEVFGVKRSLVLTVLVKYLVKTFVCDAVKRRKWVEVVCSVGKGKKAVEVKLVVDHEDVREEFGRLEKELTENNNEKFDSIMQLMNNSVY